MAIAIGVAAPGFTAPTPAGASVAQEKEKLTSLAQRYLTERADKLLTKKAPTPAAGVPMGVAMSARVSSLDKFLEDKRGRLARTGLTYETATVSVTPTTVESTGTRAVLGVHEVAELFPPADSAEPSTAYSVDRIFTFERHGADWRLIDQGIGEKEGIPPITEAADVPRVSAASAASGSGSAEYNYGTTEPLSYADAASDTNGEEIPLEMPSSEDGTTPIGDGKPDDAAPPPALSSGEFGTQAIPAGLCYTCMRDYAYRYWDNYNTSYRNFAANGGGGDCTNFISQIMRYGGWTFDYGWYKYSWNWWYNSLNQTYTWAGAENWSQFAPRRTNSLSNVWYMSLADVLQMDFNRDGIMDHTMLVTYRSSSNIYLTYHSSDHKNRPLTDILSSYTSSWYYAYRT
ncbi:amidase domain-containing protein [Micromonospora sp. CPCC 206171]|uniref:amidase domain-containing protein n=1 Tax=Micromonospora sp. CPCC 206171 TaxID=3122405 RepID=UPI002FEEF489